MNQEPLLELIRNLSYRVDGLENLQYKFWIPTILALIAIAVSIVNIVNNQRQAKANTLRSIKSNIDLAKSQVERLTMEMAPLKAKASKVKITQSEAEELKIKEQVFESAVERLLNGYNDGCDRFYKDQIDRRDFCDLYHQDIRDYIEGFEDKFQGPLTRFDLMIRYYNEFHKTASI